jgi:membrane fusion protein (multidrug efflux system)
MADAPLGKRGDAASGSHLISVAADAQLRETEARSPAEKPPDRPDRPDDGGGSGRDAGAKAKSGADQTDQPQSRSVLGFVQRHPFAVGLAAIVLIGALVAGVLWYVEARHWESTDDAFVDSRQFSMAPKVSGYVAEVAVGDNQHVAAGDLIARLDERDYTVAVDQAQAQVNSAKANVQSAEAQIAAQQAQVEEAQAQIVQLQAALRFAEEEAGRAQELVSRGAGTLQSAQQTTSNLAQARANLTRGQASLNAAQRQVAVLEAQRSAAAASLSQANAQFEQARLNLSYTKVTAAQPGRVVRLTAAKGQLAQAGQALSMFVPDEMWITANYKETQLADMKPGQRVELTIDAYPGRALEGHVDSVQPGSGTAFSLLPAQNATGNYVKVVQRVPVKLVFDRLPDDVTIGPGMSVVPKVRVR